MWNRTTCSTRKSELLGYFYFQQPQPVVGIMMVQLNLLSQQSELLGYFYFNNSTWHWDNDGTAKPSQQK
jgi:hypothetical protein